MMDVRSKVIQFMSWSGHERHALSTEQWTAVYLLGDGFGEVSRAWAEEQCWDWSHIRDSSPEAFERMWAKIRKYTRKGKVTK
jgi:hypothetical protein